MMNLPNKIAMPYFRGSTIGYITMDVFMTIDKEAHAGIRYAEQNWNLDDFTTACMDQLIEMESLMRADQQKYGIDKKNTFNSTAATIAMKRAFLNNTISNDYRLLTTMWCLNIHSLLLLKKIENDNMNGWLIVDTSKKDKMIVSVDGEVS
jgi:hypothetical protein